MIMKYFMLSLIIIAVLLLIMVSSNVDRNWFLLFCIKGFIVVGAFMCCRIITFIHFASYVTCSNVGNEYPIIKFFNTFKDEQLRNSFITSIPQAIIIVTIGILMLYVYICVKCKCHSILAPMIINVLPLSVFFKSSIDNLLYNKITLQKIEKSNILNNMQTMINEKTKSIIAFLSIMTLIVFVAYICCKKYLSKTNNENNMIYMFMTISVSVIVGMLLAIFVLYLSNNNSFSVGKLMNDFYCKDFWLKNGYMLDVMCQLGFVFTGISDMIFLYKLNKKSNQA